MNHSWKIRVLSMILAVVMVIGLVPVNVFATETEGESTAPETVVVKFDVNGGVGEYEDQAVVLGEKIAKPEVDPTREAYTFAYWTADLEANVEWNFEEDVVTEEMTLYASWTATENSGAEVTEPEHIHAGGTATCKDQAICECGEAYGELAAHSPNEDGTVCTVCEAVLVEEEPEHIHAGGTATCKELAVCECGEAYGELADHTPSEDGTVCTVCAASLTMFVEEETYLVTFNANSGKGTMEIQVISSGKLNKNTFTRDTSQFMGWNTKANGTGTAYADEAEITLTENITLYAQWDDIYYNTISETTWDIAPGITEKQIVLNNDAGTYRQVLFVMEADLNNEYVKVINSYTGMKPKYGNYMVSGMTNQAAIAEEMGYGNVVGAMNTTLSWYTGYAADRVNEPLGFIMVDAEIYFDPANCGYTYGNVGFPSVLVINKDFDENGNPRPADIPKVEMPQIRSAADLDGWEEQVIPCSSGYIVKDGMNEYANKHSHADAAPRSVVGFKPDGTVVIMVNDGRQSPYSAGMSMYELAEVMLDLGCTYAVNCDGGGSTTWVTQRPGEELKINNQPSDGAERSTTTGILFISTAPANGDLYKAHITTEDTYYTPGSAVQFNAIGTDMGGTEVEIPADALWQLSDASFGTIDNTGLFTSNGKEGEVNAQIIYNDKVVGEATITIVIPELTFKTDKIVIGYGDSMMLPIEVTTNEGRNTVTYSEGDIVYTLSDNALGTIVGDQFTACDESSGLKNGTLTAYICGQEDKAVTAEIRFGKASEIVYDFEDGEIIVDTSKTGNIGGDDATDTGEYIYGWHINDTRANGYFSYRNYTKKAYSPIGYDIPTALYVADRDTGMVRNGEYAMGIDIDWTWVTASCHGQMDIHLPEPLDLTDATRVGFWMYLPAEIVINTMQVSAGFRGGRVDYKLPALLSSKDGIDNGGWYYFSWEVLDTYKFLDYIQINSHYTAGEGNYNYYQDISYYIDDLTVDYSDATIDRENPYFTSMTIADEYTNGVEISGQTIMTNTVTLMAQAYENTAKPNATGLNRNSVKLYVDGKLSNAEIAMSAAGTISVPNLYLNDGVHTLVMEISDNQGNVGNIVRKLVVNTEKSTVRLEVPASDKLLPTDSIYWVNLVADNLAEIKSVTTTINLDYVNDWELEGMEVAYGFKAEYYVNVHNDAVITFTRIGDEVADTTILAKLPVRIWTAKGWLDDSGIRKDYISNDPSKQDKYHILTPHAMWYSDGTRDYRLVVGAEAGVVTFLDGSIMTFSANETVIQTEMNRYYTNVDRQGKWSFHIHTAGDPQDLAATCTNAGYTGRVFCVGCACGSVENLGAECDTHNGCGSVIDWGTVVPATGHSYDFIDGILQCVCGDLFTGIHTDGKAYENGVVVSDGWVNDSYYRDGVLLTGVQKVPAPDSADEFYYDFGENGICENQMKYSGMFQEGELYRYAYLGVLTSGWQQIDNEWYYFSSSTMAAVSGTVMIGSVNYDFEENGKLASGVWVNAFNGYRYYYGPGYHYWGWREIDGEWYLFDKGLRVTGYNRVGQINDLHHTKWFYFDENGVSHGLANGMGTANDGTVYFFVEGETVTGLREVNGEYYFFTAGGGLIRNQKYYVWETHCDLPLGTYEFDADGKLVDGIVEKENGTYYYTLGQVGQVAGLINVDGDYYFVEYSGKCATGKVYTWKTNCDLSCDTYEFGADGKMLNGIVERDGETYYYTNGKVGKIAGLTLVGDDYYFIEYSGKCATGKLYAWKTNCDLPVGTYEFGADGKMLNGIVEGEDGVYYYINGRTNKDKSMVGLVKIGEDYYFVGYDGICYTGKVYVWATQCELPCDTYEFGADGKMLNGIVERDGETYYYTNGKVGKIAGLTLVGDDYYFVEYSGKCSTGKLYAWKTNCDLPCDTYEFGADGKMLNGIVEKDGKIYCYVLGGFGKVAGLTKVGDDYYFVNYDGTCATGKLYAWATNCDLPTGNYEFGDDGKALNGFVTRNGELYYFVNGQPGMVGINYIDGHYYFVEYGGKLVVNCVYEVWQGNGILAECKYTFNEKGQIVG